MRWIRRCVLSVVVVVVVALVVLNVTGYFLFTRAHEDPLSHADAIVVLGGEQDGRVQYGVQLAQQGYASTVLLSNPYPSGTPGEDFMQHYCNGEDLGVRIICFAPDPSTTRGEAMFTRDMARKYGWHHVIAISWRFHLPRARYIFHQCFSGQTTMRAVPRTYDYGVGMWQYTYVYQTVGFVKAAILGC
ncbi:YdcF family protein [Gordonia jinhuaensis]|uniref:YdcF family protein n=1 Tax=Gordonia jinhuaensis TaxID=1517702 RepID=UPI00166DAA72|nr:YdcF family protein [Gordonia jinhuaensis]